MMINVLNSNSDKCIDITVLGMVVMMMMMIVIINMVKLIMLFVVPCYVCSSALVCFSNS